MKPRTRTPVILATGTASARWLERARTGIPVQPGELVLVLAQARLDRKHRRLREQRSAVLRTLEQRRCSFSGPIERPHHRLAGQLDVIDAALTT